jgi:iron complex outermembrane receptor protein
LVQPNSGYNANSYGLFGEHPTANSYDSDSVIAPSVVLQQAGVSLKYVHDFGAAQVSLLSAYRHVESDSYFSLAYTNPTEVPPGYFSDLDVQVHDVGETYQEEALLTGSASKLVYTAGLFFFYSDQGYLPPGGVGVRGAGPFLGSTSTDRIAEQLTNSYAAFGQASYAIAEDTKLTAGLRYTVDYQRATEELLDGATGQPVPPPSNDGPLVSGRAHFPKITWRFALEHNFTDNIMAYLSDNRGFKSGLFNLSAGPLPTAPRGSSPASVEPEQLDAYEIGLKSEFFNNQVRVNLAAFHYKYQNIQVSKLINGTLVLFNAGSANLSGGELETLYLHQLGPGTVQLNASAAYLDAHYGEFCNGPDSRSAAEASYNGGAACDPTVNGVRAPRPYSGDLTGDTMIESPKVTYQVGADYRMPVAGNELGFNVNYSWTARFFWEPDDRIQQPSYGIVNSQVSYGFGPGGRYTAALWGHNIGNKLYYIYGVSSATFGDSFGAGAPRTYGATFWVKF